MSTFGVVKEYRVIDSVLTPLRRGQRRIAARGAGCTTGTISASDPCFTLLAIGLVEAGRVVDIAE